MRTKVLTAVALAVLALGSLNSASDARTRYRHVRYSNAGYRSNVVVPAGTQLTVRLDSQISTENAQTGDPWQGTVTRSVVASGGNVAIPAGSRVEGVLSSAAQGTHQTPAQLGLAVQRVDVNGQSYRVNAYSEPIVAGSHRANKLGAIALGAGAGALLGHTVAKNNHGTLIGGILGGAAGYGLTRNAMRTMELKPGTVITFTTNEDIMARR